MYFGLPIELSTESGGLLFKKLKLSFEIWQRKNQKKKKHFLHFEKQFAICRKIEPKKKEKKKHCYLPFFLMFLGGVGDKVFFLKFSCVASFTGSSKKDLASIGNSMYYKKTVQTIFLKVMKFCPQTKRTVQISVLFSFCFQFCDE